MVSARTLGLFSGSWSLLNITVSQDGAVVPLDGWNPTGLISYTPQGLMQVMIQVLGQASGGNGTADLGSLGSLAQLATIDYAGRYRFEAGDSGAGTAGTVVHGPIEFTSVPGWLGNVFSRNFAFASDGQYLSLEGPVDDLTAALWWQKSPTTENWTWQPQA